MNKIAKQKKLCVMASGEGTNAETIAKHFQNFKNVEMTFVCNKMRMSANVYARLEKHGFNCICLPYEDNENFFKSNKFDLVALAGYMRILTPKTLTFSTFVNLHPSLLPKFKGKNAIERTFYSEDSFGGVTIHFVIEKVDSGEIIVQKKISKNNLSLEEFAQNIHKVEHELYPQVIEKILFAK